MPRGVFNEASAGARLEGEREVHVRKGYMHVVH